MIKRILIIICLSFFVFGCIPSGTFLKKDRCFPDRVNIRSGTYKTEGYIKPDRWESGRLNIYDKYGRQSKIYLKKDRWDPKRVNIRSGTYKTEGYLKPDRWESDRLNVYDNYGKSTGTYIKRDRWLPDRYNIKGKRTTHP